MWNSLRIRLTTILLGLAIGPLLLAGVIVYQRTYAFEQKQALALQGQVALNVSTEVESLFQGVVNNLSILGGEIEGLDNPDRAQQLSLMLGALSSGTNQDAYEELILLNSQGRELIRLSRQEIVPTANLVSHTGQEDYQQPIANREIYFSPVQFDDKSGQTFITVAIPLYEPRSIQLNNVLIAKLRFGIVSNLLAYSTAGENQTFFITDMDGNLIAHEDRSVKLQGTHLKLPAQASIRPGLDGTNVALAFHEFQLGQQTFNVIAERPASQALALANTIVTTLLFIVALALIFAVALGFLAIQQIVVPIEKLGVVAQSVTAGDLSQQAPVIRNDEIGILANAFNSMTSRLRDLIAGLEQRIAERTTDLEISRQQSEKRARELQTIGEISGIVASEQKTETLLPLVTRLVSERFDFYHVGIFLVDETRQWAVLQAANSVGGQNMLAHGHKLDVGATGIVGYVTQKGIPRIALDVGADPVFFNNPDLPATRSEMALPLNVRGRTIGALDVQSTRPGAFTENDANTLSILADQIAISIENAKLFGRTQSALAEIQSLYRQDIAKGWALFTQDEGIIGYHKSLTVGKLVNQPLDTAEIRETMNSGSVTVLNADKNRSESTLVVPLKLRGQVIGVLNIKASKKEHQWSFDEIGLAETISERLALALENARLIQDSQKRAAKEQAIGEITTKISGSINMRNVLQTAVEELGRALPGSEVIIEFDQKNGNLE